MVTGWLVIHGQLVERLDRTRRRSVVLRERTSAQFFDLLSCLPECYDEIATTYDVHMAKTGKRDGEQVIARRFKLLRMLPVAHGLSTGLSASTLTESLHAAGYICDPRTVERDLEAINSAPEWKEIGVALVRSQDLTDRRRSLWAHTPNSKALLFAILSPQEAMLMNVLEQELKALLPAAVHPVLSRVGRLAEDVLALPNNRNMAQFHERIRVLSDGPLEIAAPSNPEHLATIADALLQGVQLEMAYWSSKTKAVQSYQVHPVGLVKQGLFFWLLAIKDEYAHDANLVDRVQTFRIDRMRAVDLRQYEVVAKRLPRLDEALAKGGTKFFPTDQIQLHLRFAHTRSGAELCLNYRDTPLSHDQVISESADGVFELTATVRLSHQLKWMLQGQAQHVKVLSPQHLQSEIAKAIHAAAALYA